MKKAILLTFSFLFLISCETMETIYLESQMKKAMLSGRVFSEEGLPIDQVTVKLTNVNTTKTDINGRFLFNKIRFGKYNVVFEKEGYTDAEYSFEYNFKNKKLPFIKINMHSLNYLVKEGFEYLKEQNYEKVEEIIGQIDKIDNRSEISFYLKGIYHYTQKEYDMALPYIEKLKENDRENDYYILTLIEVYNKLEMHEKEAKLCIYIAKKNPELYYEYLKRGANIYQETLESKELYEQYMNEYSIFENKYNESK